MDNEKELKDLNDEEMEKVSGGDGDIDDVFWIEENACICPTCGKPARIIHNNRDVFGECIMCGPFNL